MLAIPVSRANRVVRERGRPAVIFLALKFAQLTGMGCCRLGGLVISKFSRSAEATPDCGRMISRIHNKCQSTEKMKGNLENMKWEQMCADSGPGKELTIECSS